MAHEVPSIRIMGLIVVQRYDCGERAFHSNRVVADPDKSHVCSVKVFWSVQVLGV